jgi:hypothetical protein
MLGMPYRRLPNPARCCCRKSWSGQSCCSDRRPCQSLRYRSLLDRLAFIWLGSLCIGILKNAALALNVNCNAWLAMLSLRLGSLFVGSLIYAADAFVTSTRLSALPLGSAGSAATLVWSLIFLFSWLRFATAINCCAVRNVDVTGVV